MIYEAIAFRQTESSPVQVAFVAPTSELDQWARVPTRLSSQPQGFQRAEIKKHVEEILQFFKGDDENRNSSPTSILLGVDPELRDHVRVLSEQKNALDESSIGTTPTRCLVELDWEPWDSSQYEADIDAEIRGLLDSVVPRLVAREAEVAEEPVEETLSADEEAGTYEADEDYAEAEAASDEEAEEESVDEEESSGSIDPLIEPEPELDPLTQEEIRELEFLAGLSPSRLTTISGDESYRQWPEERKAWLVRALKDELKPGLIIDGQHRVRGTKDLEDIPFLVNLLPDAEWPELAFQFIVNNGSAKRVSNNLLMAIVGQSLSPPQLESIEARLLRAGIKVSLIRASMRLQIEANPFQGMLNTGTPGEPGFLDATAMQRKVVEVWFGRRDKSGLKPRLLTLRHPFESEAKKFRILDLFGANCPKGKAAQKAEFWQSGDAASRGLWFEYFSAFWEAVRDTYSPRLWPPSQEDWPSPRRGVGGAENERLKLMRATMLGLLQHCVLYRWAEVREIYLGHQKKKLRAVPISPTELRTEVKEILKPLTEDFFLEHRATGLDASDTTRFEFSRQCYLVLSGAKRVAEVKKTTQWAP